MKTKTNQRNLPYLLDFNERSGYAGGGIPSELDHQKADTLRRGLGVRPIYFFIYQVFKLLFCLKNGFRIGLWWEEIIL